MRQTQVIAVSELVAGDTGHRVEANTAIVENSGVWARASAGEVLIAEESLIVERLLDNLWGAQRAIVHSFYELGDEVAADGVVSDFAEFLYRNPGIYEIWTTQQLRQGEARSIISGRPNRVSPGVEEIRKRVQTLVAQSKVDEPARDQNQ